MFNRKNLKFIEYFFSRLEAMMTAEYILELGNVFHSGQVG